MNSGVVLLSLLLDYQVIYRLVGELRRIKKGRLNSLGASLRVCNNERKHLMALQSLDAAQPRYKNENIHTHTHTQRFSQEGRPSYSIWAAIVSFHVKFSLQRNDFRCIKCQNI